MKKINFKAKTQQAGFTLIELIVVIVILGIMAATALPKFLDVGTEARIAKMKAAAGAVQSAAALGHAAWQADGAPASGGTYNGVVINSNGYPTAATIEAAAGLTDYEVDTATGVITPDTEHTACAITYVPTTGLVTGVDTGLIATNCD